MEFFERAHVPKKAASKMENKPSEAVKRQLKQMMSAYRQGNNQGIRKSSVIKPKFDMDETVSLSDFSEFSVTKNADNSVKAMSSNSSDNLQSTGNSSKSDSSDTDDDTGEDSSEDITECCEEFKSLSTSMDVSASTSFSNSAVFESDSNASEVSIPRSLQTSPGSDTDISDDDFDADGTLASKILENLVKRNSVSKKRKIPNENVEVSKDVNKTKEKSKTIVKGKKKTEKIKQGIYNNSTEYFLEEEFASDLENSKETLINLHELKKEMISKDTNKKKQKQSHPVIELSDESINNSIDSISTSFSSPFISISADDMSEQNFSDLVSDYVHPTIRNLPTDKPHIHNKSMVNMFPTDKMIVKDVIDDEISSLVPEVDEDLAIEDLNLDTDTQELIEESNAFNDIIPSEGVTETYPIEDNDITTETIPLDESTMDDDITEEAIPIKLYTGKAKYILVMKHPAELYIHGKVQMADINGMVEILGYKLNYDSVNVYAPYYNYAHCLKTLENPHQTNPDLYNELISVGLSHSDAAEILSNIEEHTAVIILSKLNSLAMDFVDNNFSTTDLFSKRSDYTPRLLKKAADNLGCSFYLKPPKKSFERKTIWDEVYEIGKAKSRGIICGGKGVGKSTFLRHYVNTLLAGGPVLVIDLDPGQAEFTVPGNISVTVVEKPLIGPNFTHLKTPERMLNIGIINTMDNAKRYITAVKDLITYCRETEEFQELPWIVNTMGLCNHMGLKFMTAIILQLQPTFLFQLDSKVPKKRFEVQLDFSTVMNLFGQFSNDKSFWIIPPNFMEYSFITDRHENAPAPPRGNVGLTLLPRDERYLNILAYFGKLLNDRSQALLDIVPYEVNLRDLKIGLNVRIPRDMVAEVINGKIIALCQQNAHDKGQVFTLGDNALLCHGHGLIRGIDLKQGILYILTPTHLNKLHLVNTLVYSDWMPELRGLERDLPGGTAVPFRTANTALHQRKLMFPPRRRFNPLQLLKMSRSS